MKSFETTKKQHVTNGNLIVTVKVVNVA